MGVPAVEVSAIPMSKILPNVMDLPLVSRFAKMAIAAATAEFVAPKSMTINIQEMLSTAAIGGHALSDLSFKDGQIYFLPTDSRAIGVFIITIHHGEDLAAKDRNGKSDPYIVIAYAKVCLCLMYNLRRISTDFVSSLESPCIPHELSLGSLTLASKKRQQYCLHPMKSRVTKNYLSCCGILIVVLPSESFRTLLDKLPS